MLEILKRNSSLASLVLACSLTAAAVQVWIPSLVQEIFESLANRTEWISLVLLLLVATLLKGAAVALTSGLSSKLEVRIRYKLIALVCQPTFIVSGAKKITLIKEDCERVASALVDLLSLLSSLALTVFAVAYLLNESFLFVVPLAIVVSAVLVYLRFVRPSIERKYNFELSQEELYKRELSLLIFQVENAERAREINFKPGFRRLSDSVSARLVYERSRSIVSFVPELSLAISTAGMLAVIFFFTQI